MSFYPDEFIVETVVSNNEILSDDSSTTHSRPFGEPSFSAIVSKGTTVGLHNAYIAVGTFATAIFIVAMVVSTCVDRRPSNLFCRIEFMSMTDVDVQYPFPTRPCRLVFQLIHIAHFCLSSMPFFFRSAVATETLIRLDRQIVLFEWRFPLYWTDARWELLCAIHSVSHIHADCVYAARMCLALEFWLEPKLRRRNKNINAFWTVFLSRLCHVTSFVA